MNTAALQRYLDFDESDLIQNRQGLISAKQTQKIERERNNWADYSRMAFAGMICLAIGFIIFRNPLATTASVCGNVLFVLFVTGGFTIFAISKWNRARMDLVKPEITMLQGKALLKKRRQRDGMYYFLQIKDTQLKIHPTLFKLLKTNQSYVVYLAARSRIILAIESDNPAANLRLRRIFTNYSFTKGSSSGKRRRLIRA